MVDIVIFPPSTIYKIIIKWVYHIYHPSRNWNHSKQTMIDHHFPNSFLYFPICSHMFSICSHVFLAFPIMIYVNIMSNMCFSIFSHMLPIFSPMFPIFFPNASPFRYPEFRHCRSLTSRDRLLQLQKIWTDQPGIEIRVVGDVTMIFFWGGLKMFN